MLRAIQIQDRIFSANDRKLFANDRILSVNDRVFIVNIINLSFQFLYEKSKFTRIVDF